MQDDSGNRKKKKLIKMRIIPIDKRKTVCYYMGVNDNHSHLGGADGKNG